MEKEPADLELSECVKTLKNKKQPEEDGIMAEALKYERKSSEDVRFR